MVPDLSNLVCEKEYIGDDWMRWDGGAMPVASDALVDVVFDNGTVAYGNPAALWDRSNAFVGNDGITTIYRSRWRSGAIAYYRLHNN
jgi:hypothetical protein